MPIARTSEMELLDTSVNSVRVDELRGNLRDIRRANRFFGGARAVINAIGPHLKRLAESRSTVRVLDLATGSADIPVAIATHAKRRGWDVEIVATDVQPNILAVAATSVTPGIVVESADARALPYADRSFDIAVLSLALHHFEPDEGLQVLSEMRRVSRAVMIVNDLERSRPGLAGAWLFAHGMTRNPMTRNDAPLSVRRAYTLSEATALARAAGWREPRTRRVFPFRYVLTGSP